MNTHLEMLGKGFLIGLTVIGISSLIMFWDNWMGYNLHWHYHLDIFIGFLIPAMIFLVIVWTIIK